MLQKLFQKKSRSSLEKTRKAKIENGSVYL